MSEHSFDHASSDSLKAFSAELVNEFGSVREGYEDRDAIITAALFVKALRRNAGLTQAQLAERMNTTQPEIVRLEAGAGKRGLTMQMLERVGTACGGDVVLGFRRHSSVLEESSEQITWMIPG